MNSDKALFGDLGLIIFSQIDLLRYLWTMVSPRKRKNLVKLMLQEKRVKRKLGFFPSPDETTQIPHCIIALFELTCLKIVSLFPGYVR